MTLRQPNQLIISVLLIVLTLTVFWQVLDHDYILYDDPGYVFQNPHMQHGLTMESLRWAFTATYEANWHPLTWLSHMLDYDLYGPDPAGHHATNLMFHVANVLLLFWVLSQMTGYVLRSAFVAALFAIHPLHVESVAWIAERKDVLSTFFWMLTVWAYFRYTKNPDFRKYLLVVFMFALGLMSKPMLVSLPLVLLMLDWWPLERLRFGWKLVWEKTPLFAMSAASSVITYIAQQKGNAVRSLESIPMSIRAGNSVMAYFSYLLKMVLPRGLAVIYPYRQGTPPPPPPRILDNRRSRPDLNLHLSLNHSISTAASVFGNGMVVVRRYPDPCNRVGTGGVSISGRQIHLCAAHRDFHSHRMGRSGPLASGRA